MSKLQIKVGMLILMESDLAKAIEFYKQLGFLLKFHIKEKWAEFALGDIKFGLCPTINQPYDRHSGIVLEVNDIEVARQKFAKENILFLAEPAAAPHGIMASIKDPSGNIIDLYQPTPEKMKELLEQVTQEK